MTEKIKACWKSLDRRIIVNQRELVLGLAVCTLAGIVTGIMLSPKKNVTIGSNNGSNNSGSSAALPSDTFTPADEKEAAEE